MKKFLLYVTSLTILLSICNSCGNGTEKETDQSMSVIELQSYNYDLIAQLNVADTLQEGEGSDFCRVSGQGILPLKIGKADIHELRDSLSKLGGIIVVNENLIQPALDNEMELTERSPESTDACSVMVNELSVNLITPQLVVWKDYSYSYPCGAAHGMYATNYINYSIEKERILDLEQLFGADYKEKLENLIRQKIKEQDITLLVSIDEITVPEDFRLTTNSIEFIYSLYEIAPYSEGEVKVELSRYEVEEYFLPGVEEILFGPNFD